MTFPYRLSTLGEPRLHADGAELLSGRRKELVLLAYLAREAPRRVPRAELAALLWGDAAEHRARASLRQALLKLRRAVGDAIAVTADDAGLVEGAVMLDVDELEADVGAGHLEAAVARWSGDFLPGAEELGTEPLRLWVEVERERVRRLYRTALERLVTAAEQRGEWGSAVRWARAWADSDPYGEPAHMRLIQALRLAAEPDGAAAAHAAFIARYRHDLGELPSADFMTIGEATAPISPRPSPPSTVPSSSALFTPDMVGRAGAFGALVAAWETARASARTPPDRGSVVVVDGEEGMGKTRLCEEFVRWVETFGGESFILRSRAYTAERARAWSAARHLLGGLGDAPGLGGAPEDALAAVSRLAPSVRDRFPRLPDPGGGELQADEALDRVLASVAAEVPVLLALDDYSAADPETQALLATLARHPPSGVLLLLTVRTGVAGTDSALEPFREIPGARRITLEPLTRAEIEALLASMLVLDSSDRREIAARLEREAAGNPFYTTALVAALADAEHLSPDASGVWRMSPASRDGALPLPVGVREAVRTRLDHLSPLAREVLGVAAVLGRPIDPGVLQAAVGRSPDELAAALEELLSRRLLRECPAPAAGYEFSHDLIGRVTYELLSPPRRQAAHRAILHALARTTATDEATAAAIRYHREKAGVQSRASRPRRRLGVAAVLVVLIASAIAIGAVLRGTAAPDPAADARPSLAVMDLENLSRDTLDAYLAESLTEEIASRLGILERLRIKSPRAVRGLARAGAGPVAAGEILGVDYLVEGTIRRAGERLRIAVRLTKTADGFQIWSGTYDAADAEILAVQDTIARQIAGQVSGRLVPEERRILGRRRTADPAAYHHFLRGNYHLARRTPESVLRAIEEYRRAVRLDPGFSSALAREAYGYALFLDWGWTYPGETPEELLARGLLITEQILRRDSASADAWMSRGYLFVLRDPLRHEGAVEAFQRSIDLDPGNAEVHHQLGQSLTALGRWDEAIAAYRRTLEIEPGRAMAYVPLGAISTRQGRAAEGARLADTAVLMDPSVPYAFGTRAHRRLQAGDARGAVEDATTALRLDRSYQLPARSVLASALHTLGDTATALRELALARESLAEPGRPTPTETLFLGSALVVFGRPEEAVELVERTRPRSAWLWFYLQDPIFNAIRDEPRFRRVIEQVRPPHRS